MELIFKKLTPEMEGEFFRYFDNTAFSDHDEWSSCYCLESHLSREENERIEDRAERRKIAADLIRRGVMSGYLIYCGEDIVGWVNCGDKHSYLPIIEYDEFYTEPYETGKIKVLYCIDIAPAYRGKGITHIIVDKFCEDARAEGYSYVEAYPFSDLSYPWQYHGPLKLYESHGFELLAEKSFFMLMRKKL